MTTYSVPVQVTVPAYGEVEVQADSLEHPCINVQAAIEEHEFDSIAGEVDFVTDWLNVADLSLAEVDLPNGRKFSARSQ